MWIGFLTMIVMERGTVYFVMEKAARPQHGSLILVKTCLETEVGKAEFIIDSVLCI
jgi:hypothetical protein